MPTPNPIWLNFWDNVDIGAEDECWPWLRAKKDNGYGCVWWGERRVNAHRVAWMLTNGPIPEGNGYHGTCVLHKCDNRICMNPHHLFLGSVADNNRDKMEKNRRCKRGHAYTEDNTRYYNGIRICLVCERERHARSYRRKKSRAVA